MESIYTRSERTVKKYTVYRAIESARARLRDRGFKGPVCTNAVSGLPDCHKITLEKLNQLADRIVEDTLYYGEYS